MTLLAKPPRDMRGALTDWAAAEASNWRKGVPDAARGLTGLNALKDAGARMGRPPRSEWTRSMPGQPVPPPSAERVGDRLRAGREAAGLSLAEVGQRTRVPLRHLEAIEATDFAALPSPTYAVGFARAYARALARMRYGGAAMSGRELPSSAAPPEYEPYETADPARVPSRGVAIVGWVWRSRS